MNWTERSIASYLSRVVFEGRHLMMVPNCSWTGNECDLLCITMNLRVIDIEIKISRADLRADATKDKWFHSWDWKLDGPYRPRGESKGLRRPRPWPHRVWKHYYCLPQSIWSDDLLADIAPVSGILLIQDGDENGYPLKVKRMAKPDRKAERITAEDAIDIARLANARMWDAYEELRRKP